MRGWMICVALLLLAPVLAAAPTSEHWSNGFRLIILPTTSSQVVSAEMLIDYSALDEPVEQQGIRQVLLTSMLQGSKTCDGNMIRRHLTAIGGSMQGRIHQDMLEFTVSVPAGKLTDGLNALSEVLCHPLLTDEGIRAAIVQSQQQLSFAPVEALDIASLLSYQLLYHGHPFASRGLGTADSLASITPDNVRAAYRDYLLPNAAVLAIVGRCDAVAARGQAQGLFGLWADHPRCQRPAVENPTLASSQSAVRETSVKSTCVMLTFPTCGVTHKDFLAMRLLDVLLGGGTQSRLFRHIREEQHLAYETATDFPSQAQCSHFSVFALTDSSEMEETKSALIAELASLQVTPVSEDELQRAKAYLKGRYLLSHQYSAQHAFDLAWYELVGLGAGYESGLSSGIDAITTQEIQRMARAYFTHYYLVVVIPQTVASP